MQLIGFIVSRNENKILRRNINYHLKLGLTKIYVVIHGDEMSEDFYFEDNRVIITKSKGHEFYQQKEQQKLLNYILNNENVDWIFPLDADEFICPNGTINEMIIKLENQNICYCAYQHFNVIRYGISSNEDIYSSNYGYFPFKERDWEQPSSFYKSFCKPHKALEIFAGGHFFPSFNSPPYLMEVNEVKLIHFCNKNTPNELLEKWYTLSSSRLKQSKPENSVWWEKYHLMKEWYDFYKNSQEELIKDWFDKPRTTWGSLITNDQIIYDPNISQIFKKLKS